MGVAAGAQTVVRAGAGAGAGAGDEAAEGDRDVSDDASHARADPIPSPNSSRTHEACVGCEPDSRGVEVRRSVSFRLTGRAGPR